MINDIRRWITLVETTDPVIRYVANDSTELAPTSAAEYKRKSDEIIIRDRYRNNLPLLYHEMGHALLDDVQPLAWITAFQDDPAAWQQFLSTNVARSYQQRHAIADDWRDNPSAYDWIEAGPDLYMLDRLHRLDAPLVVAILHRLMDQKVVHETVADRTAPITPREFHKAMREAIKLFKTFAWCKSMRDINEGDCGSFVGEVMEHLGLKFYERTADLQPNSTKWYLDANDRNLDLAKVRSLGEPVPDDIPEDRLAYELGSIHYWLTYRHRHYDAEALKGVDHFLDLPHFQRIIARLRGQPVTPSTRG